MRLLEKISFNKVIKIRKIFTYLPSSYPILPKPLPAGSHTWLLIFAPERDTSNKLALGTVAPAISVRELGLDGEDPRSLPIIPVLKPNEPALIVAASADPHLIEVVPSAHLTAKSAREAPVSSKEVPEYVVNAAVCHTPSDATL